MTDERVVRVGAAPSAAVALAQLAGAAPGVVDPAGELVLVDGFGEEVAADAQRWSLVPAALAALSEATEIWRFAGVEAGEHPVEHWPHLLWCSVDGAPAELVIAGTRRIGDHLHLHTWFRYADGVAAVRRYWDAGSCVHPVRRLRPDYSSRRDVLYLAPEPAVPYRVVRVLARPSMFAYLDASVGFPSVVGFEVQDARRHADELGSLDAPFGLLGLPCQVGDGEPEPLSVLLARLLAELGG